MFGGRTLIDSLNLHIGGEERARQFLKNCGMDVDSKSQRAHLECLLGEAIHFMRHVLMTPEERVSLPVPGSILKNPDVKALLLTASDQHPRKHYDRLWACSLLKIVNAIANLEHSGMLDDLHEAREQIFSRIRDHLLPLPTERDAHKPALFSHPSGDKVTLAHVDWKEEKSRSSLILKLIHKSESLSDDVFDYIGVRFVVKNRHEIPTLLDALIKKDIIIPHQVIPSRTKNNLIDIDKGKRVLKLAKDLAGHGELTAEEYRESRRNVDWTPEGLAMHQVRSNRFSSSHYRSVQLTVRHLVRLRNPAHRALIAMTAHWDQNQTGFGRPLHLLESLIPAENVRFFPLEIQIMDQESYEDSKFGPSSHERYKASQLKAARKKILGALVSIPESVLASQQSLGAK